MPPKRRSRLGALAIALAVLAALGAGMLLQRGLVKSLPPSYQQITFGSGTIRAARFAPDGQTIVYSAAWDGSPLKLFLKHPSSPDSLPLELPSANLLSISPSGEMAIAIDCRSNHPGVCAGTLARAALTGGSPRDVAEGVQEADWAPDGSSFMVVRDVGGKSRLEFPMGKILYETSGHISYARLSPKADRIAFLDHPFPLDDAGTVAVIDLAGKKTTLTSKWASEGGLAWSASGDEVWFTATEAGANRSLYAVTPAGKLRVVTRVPGGLKLHDVARSGRVLLTRESPRVGVRGMLQGDTRERDMSFLDYSFAADLTPDAGVLLFDEEGEAGGANYTVFVRKADGSPVVRLGEGNAMAISPDGKWALSMLPKPDSPFILLPDGHGRAPRDQDRRRQPGTGRHLAAGQQEHRVRGQRARPPPSSLRAVDRRRTSRARSRPRESSRRCPASPFRPTVSPLPRSDPSARRCSSRSMAAFRASSPESRTRRSRCDSPRTAALSTSGSAATCRRTSRGSSSRPASVSRSAT